MTVCEPADEVLDLLAGSDEYAVHRTLTRVIGMHAPDHTGRCPYCPPEPRARRFGWRRRMAGECPTRRVIIAELRTAGAGAPGCQRDQPGRVGAPLAGVPQPGAALSAGRGAIPDASTHRGVG